LSSDAQEISDKTDVATGWTPEEDDAPEPWMDDAPGMRAEELIEALQASPEGALIRIAQQPSYPLRAIITNVRVLDGVVWIATSEHHSFHESPYAPRDAWTDGED
jgi:hypothetical protein